MGTAFVKTVHVFGKRKYMDPIAIQFPSDPAFDGKDRRMANYYESERWKHLSEAAIRRAGGRCQLCNRSGLLEAHHRTYSRFGWESLEHLTALCPRCHRHHHGTRQSNRRDDELQLKLPI